MVRVIPFKALRYNENKIGDLSKVVAPPYDIMKGEIVDYFQGLSPYNIAWVTKNKPAEEDTRENNQYTRAGDLLNRLVEENILTQDEKKCFYIYGQNFSIHDKNHFRFGFIGLLELEEFAMDSPGKRYATETPGRKYATETPGREYATETPGREYATETQRREFATETLGREYATEIPGREYATETPGREFTGVSQHEETLPKDIEDRLNLSRATLTQFGQIFVIYPDHERKIDIILARNMEERPLIDLVDNQRVRHRLWAVRADKDIDASTNHMRGRYIIIADGHHRYKTALALMKERPELESVRYRMVTFVNMANPGLVVLPTHRLVQNIKEFDKERLLKDIKELFSITEHEDRERMFADMEKSFARGGHSFGLYIGDEMFYVFTLKDIRAMDRALPDRSNALRRLDVSILHSLILDRVLGIDREKLVQGTMGGEGYVVYIKGIGDAVDEAITRVKSDAIDEAITRVKSNAIDEAITRVKSDAVDEAITRVKSNAQAVFYMNPTRIEEVEAVATNFECMPQKSTFFYPKVWTGFTINILER